MAANALSGLPQRRLAQLGPVTAKVCEWAIWNVQFRRCPTFSSRLHVRLTGQRSVSLPAIEVRPLLSPSPKSDVPHLEGAASFAGRPDAAECRRRCRSRHEWTGSAGPSLAT